MRLLSRFDSTGAAEESKVHLKKGDGDGEEVVLRSLRSQRIWTAP